MKYFGEAAPMGTAFWMAVLLGVVGMMLALYTGILRVDPAVLPPSILP